MRAVPTGSWEPPTSQYNDIHNPYSIRPPSRTAHGQAVPAVGSATIPGLDAGLSPDMRGIVTEVVRSTFYDEIAFSALVPAAVIAYLRFEEGRMAYTTASYDTTRAEGTIKYYMHLPEGA